MIAASTPNEPAASGTPVCVATEDGGNPSLSLSQQATEVSKKFDKECQGIIDWLLTLRAPLALIAALAMVPHLINLWIVAILVKPLVSWGLPRCPQPLVDKMQSLVPQSMRRSEFLRDLGEGTDQGLPFILFWLYIFCVPFALCWMAAHWVKDLMPTHSKPTVSSESAEAQIVFTQNKKSDSAQSDSNFYHSKAFGIVLVLFFALGIPAYISLGVYEKLGVSKAVEHEKNVVPLFDMPSDLPQAEMPALGIVSRGGHHGKHQMPVAEVSQGEDATYVAGYNSYWPVLKNLGIEPTLKSIFFVHFYLIGLASALTILFFRAWFTFPLNFLRDEHDVEFTASGIKKRTMKGWFLSVITINRWSIGGGPDSLRWHEVKSLRHLEEGFTKLYPLPDTAFRKESLTYKLLNKCAAFFDGLTNQANAENFLVFSASKKGNDFGRNIQINLKELNREQRARLFYLVKQWAPHVEIMKNVEEKLIGSTVLTDVRYTQLWFDLLTSKARPQRQNVLCVGDTLKNNQFTIDERLSSGGQATTYLARNSAGAKCVLKEFILATSSTSGALIESAREFEAEVSLLSQLRHPGIVRLEDYFCEDGRVYVVLEYIAGQSLRQMVSQVGPLDQQEVVRIGLAICDVLEYLHGCNPPIVHRDITPENIIIQPDGAIKLIDFSLAVKQDGRPTTDSCAKQAFTPPEQFREEVCVQSDIYALGATMYYLLLAENPKPISRSSPMAKAPHVMPKLNAIVERATELDLHHRYESVAWLKLDLEQTKTD
jgi:tRNA A-37 threonylcarbamoyl transferase component Bud32